MTPREPEGERGLEPVYPDGVWETVHGITDEECLLDWPVLRDAPGWQRVVTGPSGYVWTWRLFPRFPNVPTRLIEPSTPPRTP